MTAETEGAFISMKMLLTIFAGIIMLGLIFAAQGNIAGIVDSFCSATPWFCGGNTTDVYSGAAIESAKAVACAATVVGTGKQDSCLNKFSGGKQVTDSAAGKGSNDNSNPSGDKSGEVSSGVTTVDCKINLKGDYECNVKDFYLPQNVGAAAKWIAGFGDPEYLVYWQDFQAGEEAAWSGYSTLLDNALIITLFAIPFGRAERLFGVTAKEAGIATLKATGTGIKTVYKATANKLLGREASKEFAETVVEEVSEKGVVEGVKDISVSMTVNFQKQLEGVSAKEGLIAIIGSDASKATRMSMWKKALSSNFVNAISEGAKDYKGVELTRLLKRAGVATVAALAYAWFDNVNEKFNTHFNKIVVKRPYSELVKIDVDTGIDTSTNTLRPIIVEKSVPLGIDQSAIFYQASPCRSDITFKKGFARCDGLYQYDPIRRAAICKLPVLLEDDTDLPACGLNQEIDLEGSVPVYEKTKKLFEDVENRKLFEQDENGLKKIYLPWQGKDVFLGDIKYEGEGKLSRGIIDLFDPLESDRLKLTFSTDEIKTDLYSARVNGRFQKINYNCINSEHGTKCFLALDTFDPNTPKNILPGKERLTRHYPAYEFISDGQRFYMQKAFLESDPGMTGNMQIVELADGKGDGTFNTINLRYTGGSVALRYYQNRRIVILQDSDDDGEIDVFGGTNCKVSAIKATSTKIAYDETDGSSSKSNYCHFEPTLGSQLVGYAGIATDVALVLARANVPLQIGVGIINGAVYTYARQFNKWPG